MRERTTQLSLENEYNFLLEREKINLNKILINLLCFFIFSALLSFNKLSFEPM